ncbi:MAG: hypothetical protein KIS66_01435 [Fimbriimonadaceae bacterium]|nr:hypothetical protein [Fimbriimonadaceae bacterium]
MSEIDRLLVRRRDVLRYLGVGAATVLLTDARAVAGPFAPQDATDHFVPADKRLNPDWVKGLYASSGQWTHTGPTPWVGMPVGGLAAGQVYALNGSFCFWDVTNQEINSGYGGDSYRRERRPEEVRHAGVPRTPARTGSVYLAEGDAPLPIEDRTRRFCGEYPFADSRWEAGNCTVETRAFSPHVPLRPEDSSYPGVVIEVTVRRRPGRVDGRNLRLGLSIPALIGQSSHERYGDRLETRTSRFATSGSQGVSFHVVEKAPPRNDVRPPRVIADFEGADYGEWRVEGEAFGRGPAKGALPNQQVVSGFRGKALVNSFLGGNDGLRGRLVSPEFVLDRPYLGFLVGGGERDVAIELWVDGKLVRTAAGKNSEKLDPTTWDVRDLAGKAARIVIRDDSSDGWGHINVDQIELRDEPMADELGPFSSQPDAGTIAVLGSLPGEPSVRASGSVGEGRFDVEWPLPMKPGEAMTCRFVVAWHFPNLTSIGRPVGRRYAARFNDAQAVATHLARHAERLTRDTRAWHEAFYDSTLPRWLLDRIGSTVSILSTNTCQWWREGRFWAWEGVGCCHGTCGHVWNYAHALARLFPSLERNVRERQDFAPGVGFQESGAIGFRGEGWSLWAGDSQGGYILKAYREHLTSPDDAFLKRVWPRVMKATEFLIEQDGNADGLIEGVQHQTYDENYFGANTFVGSMYLGALRAAEEMAKLMDDDAFAKRCRAIFEAGSLRSMETLFNGEYFEQRVDLAKHPDWQYANGCLADQLFGQTWAHQVGLGYLYPKYAVVDALRSIWKYNWAPDVGPQNKAHAPERWFAYPGEAGLFTCTWPKSKHMGPRSTRYRDEIWTGIEYQVASHMAHEGMVEECLAICRAIHERYDADKRNPYNEVECGDHYARALASWGVLLGLSGFEFDGPAGHLGFAPRMNEESFRCVFTAAEGWGTLAQTRTAGRQTNETIVRFGKVRLRSFATQVPFHVSRATARVGRRAMPCEHRQEGDRVIVNLEDNIVIAKGSTFRVELA